MIRGQTKYSLLVLQVEGSCCLASGLSSQRLWLRILFVFLSRGGRPGSIPPTYNHEFYNQQKYHTASVVAQDKRARVIRSRGQGGFQKISDCSHLQPPSHKSLSSPCQPYSDSPIFLFFLFNFHLSNNTGQYFTGFARIARLNRRTVITSRDTKKNHYYRGLQSAYFWRKSVS